MKERKEHRTITTENAITFTFRSLLYLVSYIGKLERHFVYVKVR